jgi:hypothetical protein
MADDAGERCLRLGQGRCADADADYAATLVGSPALLHSCDLVQCLT